MIEDVSRAVDEVASAMRMYLENFDTKVSTKTAEVTTTIDQQFVRFQDALDGRAHLQESAGAMDRPSPADLQLHES